MANPLSALIQRCSRGFTYQQKIVITIAGVLYVISPLDIIPDLIPVLGWCDDGFVLFLIRRVWMSPTLPPASSAGAVAMKAQASKLFSKLRQVAANLAKGEEWDS